MRFFERRLRGRWQLGELGAGGGVHPVVRERRDLREVDRAGTRLLNFGHMAKVGARHLGRD